MTAPFEAALREAARLLAVLAAPVLLAVLFAGLLAAIVQALTRLRDRSISVAPRLLAVGLVIGLLGGWFAARIGDFSTQMLGAAVAAARAPPRP